MCPRKMENKESSNNCEAVTIGSQNATTQKLDSDTQQEIVILDVVETSGSSPNKVTFNNDEQPVADVVRSVQLYQATLKGDWKAAKTIIDKQNDIVGWKITRNSETALHIAVVAKHKGFVRKLLVKMSFHDVSQRNKDGNTALHFAAASGVVEIAGMLIKKNEHLPDTLGSEEMTPIHMAALFSQGDMVKYLYEKTNFKKLSDINLINLFLAIISADIYDVALKMLHEMAHKKLAISQNGDKETALHLMARKPDAISHKKQLNLFQTLANYISKGFVFREAKMRTIAHQVVEESWKSVVRYPVEKISALLRSPSRMLFDAAESGNVEFLTILIRSYPDLIWKVDDKSRSLFHIAVINRHESIFRIIYELGGIKDLIACYKEDKSKNNLLHLVARLPPPSRLQIVSGAALQMQRELLWFEAVKAIVPRSYIKTKNEEGHIADDLFTKEHDNLRKEGEKWMKETTTACMLVATLIATVVFASAFTHPGGTDDVSGFPKFRKKALFDIFILSDSVALFSSVTAIAIFLSILTSRYAEDDFRTALPTKLMMGLVALFVSIVSMVLAFTAAMILIREKEPVWSLILIIFLASLTALSFASLHFKLWFETLRSAYVSKFLFHGHKSSLFH